MGRQTSRRRKSSASASPNTGPELTQPSSFASRHVIALGLLVILAVLVVYSRALQCGYVYYDDDPYVYHNPMVKGGISAAGLTWAFTTFRCGNWHPLTWISYMLDQQVFGMNATAEHAVNAGLHAGTAGLLFAALFVMTRRPWRCALVAALFGIHPLHVESVAWIAERKDVLCALFECVTLLLYGRYVNRPSRSRYLWVAVGFVLSLLAKPMAVTLPLVLLLLDIWPLGRLTWPIRGQDVRRQLWEKAPLLAISAGACAITVIAQRSAGAVASLSGLPLTERLANAAAAYAKYIAKSLWPVDLAVLYPLRPLTLATIAVALVILIVITVWAVVSFRRRPYVLVGWAWYVGMLVPTIGLIQVGRQALADRYMYMPQVGLSIVAVWYLSEVRWGVSFAPKAWAAASLVALGPFGARAYDQIGYWKDSETLFRHTLAVTGDNPIIEGNLAVVLHKEGRLDEAEHLYRAGLAANPKDSGLLTNFAELVAEKGDYQAAIGLYHKALVYDPGYGNAHGDLGRAYLRTGRLNEALTELSAALRIIPDEHQFQEDMGILLAALGRYDEALRHLEESAKLEPLKAETQNAQCFVLQRLQRAKEAVSACQTALRLKPDFVDAGFNLGTAYRNQGNLSAAAAEFEHVLAQDPNYAPAKTELQLLRGRSNQPGL